ncbi:MAG: helix-hairpin-helix domain-containing protein [Saprospiraceae bacterium]
MEYCVNQVGINLNTASQQLLTYVSGVESALAANIVQYRLSTVLYPKENLAEVYPNLALKLTNNAQAFCAYGMPSIRS